MSFVGTSTLSPAQPAKSSLLGATLAALNTTCLLEALIAVVWQRGLALNLGVALGWHHVVLLFTSCWLVYAADRWLDARAAKHRAIATSRHRFFAQHSRPLAVLWGAVLLGGVGLAAFSLNRAEWFFGLCVLGGALCYLSVIHLGQARGLVKESSVAAIYTAGVGLFIWPATGFSLPTLIGAGLFAALALSNMAVIATRERALDLRQGTESLATRRSTEFPIMVGTGCLVVGSLVAGVALSNFGSWFFSISLSALALLGVLRYASSLGSDTAHAFCDLALLIPAPLLLNPPS